jgi:hypothetical protein
VLSSGCHDGPLASSLFLGTFVQSRLFEGFVKKIVDQVEVSPTYAKGTVILIRRRRTRDERRRRFLTSPVTDLL